MASKPFLPLSLSGSLFPLGDLGIESGTFLDKIGLDHLDVDINEEAGELTLRFRMIFIDEVALAAPGMDDLAFVIGPDEGRAAFPFALTMGERFEFAIEELKSLIRTPPTILAKANNTGTAAAPVRVADAPYEIDLPPISFRVDTDGNIGFEGELSLDINPCYIGDTGCVFKANGISLHLDSGGELPPGRPPGWRGLLIDEARFYLPEDFALGDVIIALDDAGVGNGGVFGTISLSWTNTLREEAPHLEGPATGTLFGVHLALKEIALTFEQNVPVSSLLRGEMLVPFFNKAIGMKLALAIDGDFTVELSAASGSNDSAHLVAMELNELLRLTVKSAQFSRIDERALFSMVGDVTPLLGGFDWPTFEVEKLSVDEDGNFDIQGGWIDLPETFSLDFHAFKIDIDEIGLGKNEETGRDWFGFSGGIRLVEGIPLSASVDGLQVSWDPAAPPTASDPLRGVQVTLEGVAVHMEIPGTLVLDGAVRYREIPRPPVARTADDSTAAVGHVFSGSISLDITALRTQVAGELLIGELTQYAYDDTGNLIIGETFPAFYIVLSAQLPAAIPLGATGTGLYGLAGLVGIHVAPDRQLIGEEPESWYEWYKADRGNESQYSVTKVVKWAPRFDNFAFGAGITIGTVYDDGFTINVGALVAVLIPGPVIMIEGKANLLKQRGEGGQGAEGALYALIVFDGLAETFQMNVDINFTLEDVITVGGGMEAFFDFNDNRRWYIHIGRKDPETKRIRAEVISIISATAYFMVDPNAIIFGATAGIDLKFDYSPLVIRLILRISFEIGLFFKYPQLTGFVELYGEISILIFGWGIRLILQTLLEGSAPQPWWIHGLARVEVSLPFPLPSFEAQVEFTWGETEQSARVSLLKGAALMHSKMLGKSWALSTTVAESPKVPVDALGILSLGKPLSGVSTVKDEDGRTVYFDFESVEGWEFGYEIRQIVLRNLDTGSVVLEGPMDPHRPWINPLGRILTDAGPSESPDASPVREPQIQLWGYAPLDGLGPEAGHNYRDPCENSDAVPKRHCVNFRDVPEGLEYGAMFRKGGLSFSSEFGRVRGASRRERHLNVGAVTVRFAEPVTRVEIQTSGGAKLTATRRGDAVYQQNLGSAVTHAVPVIIDAFSISLPSRGALAPPETIGLALIEICWVTQRSVEAIPEPGTLASPERVSHLDRPLLEPNTSYVLEVVATRKERVVGEAEWRPSEAENATYYFKTVDAPGLNPTTERVESDVASGTLSAGAADSARAIDFRDGPINQLSSYIERTTPEHGAKAHYRAYDLLIEFDASYVSALYDDALHVRITDHNGRLVLGPSGGSSFLVAGAFPLLTPGLLALLRAKRGGTCANKRKPWLPFIPKHLLCLLPETLTLGRMFFAEIMLGTESLHRFSFSLSHFADFDAHFSVDPERQLREGFSLEAGVGLDLSDFDAVHTTWVDARGRLVAAKTFGPHDAGLTMDEAEAALHDARTQLETIMHQGFAALDASVQASFEARDIDHRPRPTRLELISIRTESGGRILMVDSPEPMDVGRLEITFEEETDPCRLLFNEDTTRAYVLPAGSENSFASNDALRFEATWNRGGASYADISPLYRAGFFDDTRELVRWEIPPAS